MQLSGSGVSKKVGLPQNKLHVHATYRVAEVGKSEELSMSVWGGRLFCGSEEKVLPAESCPGSLLVKVLLFCPQKRAPA